MRMDRLTAIKRRLGRFATLATASLTVLALPALGRDKVGRDRVRPDDPPMEVPSAPVPPPSAKEILLLFSGKQEDLTANWHRRGSQEPTMWKFQDGTMMPSGGDIISNETFTDFQLHVEFKEPYLPDKHGQERGNSGVFLQGRYEIQVLDSYGLKEPGTGDCGAVYNLSAPLVNACKPPLQWQTYDITFRAPRFDAMGNKTANARVTVLQNGIVVQNNTEILQMTGDPLDKEISKPGPIRLQNHGNPVAFRNVWILPLPLEGAKHYQGTP